MERALCHAVGFGPGFLAWIPLLSKSSGLSEPASVSCFTRPWPASWVTPPNLGLVHLVYTTGILAALLYCLKVYTLSYSVLMCKPDNVI